MDEFIRNTFYLVYTHGFFYLCFIHASLVCVDNNCSFPGINLGFRFDVMEILILIKKNFKNVYDIVLNSKQLRGFVHFVV